MKVASHRARHNDMDASDGHAHAPFQRRRIVAPLASRASGLIGEHGVEEGVLRTEGRKISATSNTPS